MKTDAEIRAEIEANALEAGRIATQALKQGLYNGDSRGYLAQAIFVALER